jgi:hypothetical protein
VTAVVESPAQVMRKFAAALADPGLMAAVEEFLAAHRAAREAWDVFRLTDTGGWGGLEGEAERLDAEAEDAWWALDGSWFWRGSLPRGIAEEVESAASEYVGRRRRMVGHAVVQSEPCDWSKGR